MGRSKSSGDSYEMKVTTPPAGSTKTLVAGTVPEAAQENGQVDSEKKDEDEEDEIAGAFYSICLDQACNIITGCFVTAIGYYTSFLIASSCVMSVGAGLCTTIRVDTGASEWIDYQTCKTAVTPGKFDRSRKKASSDYMS
ncbi:MAG: hypothetical protein LQ350_008604, partial [Teloschistes chrysophthalmus]